MCHQSHFLGSYNDQDHTWTAKISKQYLLHTKLETYFSGGAGKWPLRLTLKWAELGLLLNEEVEQHFHNPLDVGTFPLILQIK
jgi:hypothetical protein